MKLIIQIPCFNEQKTLPLVLNSIPRKIKGVDKIETLIIDDGSSDNTVDVAKAHGVNHIVIHPQNKGLAHGFASGITECLRQGADIIVNTDADNQYFQADIPKLIQPILNGQADIVIGDRQTSTITHFSKLKKGFQRFGSALVRFFSGTKVPDAVSGFRAYSREAALSMNVITDFSYAIETIIQAKYKRLSIESVKIRTNDPTRKSRLFKSMWQHMARSGMTLLRIYTMYQPFRVFLAIGMVVFTLGILLAGRFIFYVAIGQGGGHVQSLILAAVLLMIGFQVVMTGVLADLMAINRKLTEQGLRKINEIELEIRSTSKTIKSTKYQPRSFSLN